MPYPASPYLHANVWSRLFHSWISHLLTTSHRQKSIDLMDLYELLPQYESRTLTEKLEDNWYDEIKRNPTKSSLIRATIRTTGWKPVIIGLLLLPWMFFCIAQPLLLIFLMDFFEPCSTMSLQHAQLLAVGSIMSVMLSTFFFHQFTHHIQMLGLQMRIAYDGLIYRKVLRLSSQSLSNFSSGNITNLLANDAGHIEMVLRTFTYLWLAPLDIFIVAFLFWYFVQHITFIAFIYALILLLFYSVYGRLYAFLQTRMLKITDERIKIITELIKSMRFVKMYCWESAMQAKVRHVRKREIYQLALRSTMDCIHASLSTTFVSLSLLLMYGTMWIYGMHFDIRFFAVAYSLLNHMESFQMNNFTSAIRSLAKYLVAEKRIRTFLLFDESQRDRRLLSVLESTEHQENSSPNNIVIIPVSTQKPSKVECNLKQAQWQQNAAFSLKNITFRAQPGDLICVIGPVGCGKSSLLQTLTGEIAFFEGKVRLRGSFCYVPQEPWIFSSTVKKNIIFGREYDGQLFRRVIRAAALEADFAQLSHGMNTVVGDQGVMLSGGQKARVNMARALYRNADIYLLDDPLSAVDVKVSKQLFERSIKNYLNDRICILVTHQIQFLQDATKIVVLENGEMVEIGTYKELLERSSSFRVLLENIHQQEEEEQKPSDDSSDVQQRRSTRCVTFSDTETDESFSSSVNAEKKQEDSVHWRVYLSYMRASAGLVMSILIVALTFGGHEAISIFYNWWLAKWSDDNSHRYRVVNNCTAGSNDFSNIIRTMNDTDWNIYQKRKFHICSGIGISLLLIVIFQVVAGKFMCLNAGRVLHNKMFQRLMRCPISFFDLNPIGRILTRFTKDMLNIDDNLPWILIDFIQCIFQIFGVIALVAWLNPWSLIPAGIAAFAMLYVRHRFARCSRDLKRLENTSRSPIYSYLNSTIHGLKVIRSYHAEKTCLTEFFAHLDDYTRANYLSLSTSRWAAIRLDWIAVFFIATVTILAIIVRIAGRHFSAVDIALTLSYSLTLTAVFQWTIGQSVDVETQMTSVERVLEYCKLDQEPSAQTPSKFQPPSNWPSHGRIVFHNVSMSHSNYPDAPLALSRISLTIEPTQKIGIVGRTGAGKSSFIQTLFRMGTLIDGHITIDDIDISTIGLDDVRRRISIIPQDPVLFTGTMRSNLDPFGDYSDTEIWRALEQVQLKRLVSDVMSNGLESLVSESGSNLSVGQKQLVCLARAILKKSKILVIDEATANVDNATDELIQRSIRDQFRECTVLTVAHRLRTVIDSDQIMVLDHGRVLEFDSPRSLLSNKTSEFSGLVEQAGAGEAEHLRILANAINSSIQDEDEEVVICNEESSEDLNETDPLLLSVKL